MPRTPRRKIDSISEQRRVAANAGAEIVPPSNVPLGSEEMLFFVNVVNEAAREEWTPHKLEMAAILSRKMRSLAVEESLLELEGSVIDGPNEKKMMNPRVSVVKGLTGDILSIRRSLQIHERVKSGDMRDTMARRANAKEIEAQARGAEGHVFDPSNLLARPH